MRGCMNDRSTGSGVVSAQPHIVSQQSARYVCSRHAVSQLRMCASSRDVVMRLPASRAAWLIAFLSNTALAACICYTARFYCTTHSLFLTLSQGYQCNVAGQAR